MSRTSRYPEPGPAARTTPGQTGAPKEPAGSPAVYWSQRLRQRPRGCGRGRRFSGPPSHAGPSSGRPTPAPRWNRTFAKQPAALRTLCCLAALLHQVPPVASLDVDVVLRGGNGCALPRRLAIGVANVLYMIEPCDRVPNMLSIVDWVFCAALGKRIGGQVCGSPRISPVRTWARPGGLPGLPGWRLRRETRRSQSQGGRSAGASAREARREACPDHRARALSRCGSRN